jgi:hypothetical protein
MLTANDYVGTTDSDRLEAAVKGRKNNIVFIPKRKCLIEPERDYWLLDRAVLLPENTTVIIQNAKIKLSDNCRDNFFRSENCGIGIDEPAHISNIHIRGDGLCILEGADHPRSTGDSSKRLSRPCPKESKDLLQIADWISDETRAAGKTEFWDEHSHTYGTDSGKDGERQFGDWRNIGILFANVSSFSIENIHMVDFHCWGVSLEGCSFGNIKNMSFEASMSKEIDGMMHNVENQDGIDLRNGCHDIIVSDITGCTGDDIVALTAIASPDDRRGGSLNSTHVMGNDWLKREKDIHDIIVRNVVGYTKGGGACGCCNCVRLLPVMAKIYNVVIDGVIDTSPKDSMPSAVLQLGEPDGAYGCNEPESMYGITINNVICNSSNAIYVLGYLQDSSISNVINRNPECAAIYVLRKDGMKNVLTSGIVSTGKKIIERN